MVLGPSPAHCPTRVHQAQGYLDAVPPLIGGRTWILVTSRGWTGRGAVEALARAAGNPDAVIDDVPANPTVSYLDGLTGVRPADVIVALGGGSVMDTAKGVAALLALDGAPAPLHAHLREGTPLPESLRPAPLICVPTTSGTGSEVTRWATVWGDEKVKFSLTDPRLYPTDAVLDPGLCRSMPRALTLASGLDALSHAMEAVWNNNHTPETDGFAETAIAMLKDHLAPALDAPDDIGARNAVQEAATIAGFAMGKTQTALAHSISYPFTALFAMPHGLACSFTLPAVAEYNLGQDSGRLQPIARALGCGEDVEAVPGAIQGWLDDMGLGAEVRRYVSAADIDGLGDNLITRARAANNLRRVDGPTARDIARRSFAHLAAAAGGEKAETGPGGEAAQAPPPAPQPVSTDGSGG